MLNLKPEIIFEDNHLVVLSKPAGLLSQGEISGEHNLVDWLRVYFKRKYVGLIHRLDRNTSGLMVVAKRSKSAQRLTDSLKSGEVQRCYLALIEGSLNESKTWHHWLVKNPKTNKVSIYPLSRNPEQLRIGEKRAQEAILLAMPKQTFRWNNRLLTLVEFTLETGRSHQIRAQSAGEGFPLLGDSKYMRENKRGADFPRTALHSFSLSFPHPVTHEKLSFKIPLPEDMAAVTNGPVLQESIL